MESFGPNTSLDLFRRDARHRRAMCLPLGEDDDRFDPIAEAAGSSLALIDAKRAELERAEDLLLEARAVEKAMRLRSALTYGDIRRRLAVEAADAYRTILPVAPSSVGSAGIKRAISILERSVTGLSREETPEVIRTEHLPKLQRELERLRTADRAEDEVAASLAALRAAVALFKIEREKERQHQYADLVKIVGKGGADDFFLRRNRNRDDEDDDAEPAPTPGG